ncbi:unnamed protein product [Kuraishia capsulata CBS 1993]|uniref:Uncharacterized protein n=1 Tax=Kuraishia capsulata CBS 1993 TaxID=1382522 RepID=W6MUG7_9ASCO|nr:uncharacterized protein KUCA_T00005255001 [Kuraishia capsulata CBS 1993]CDK29267.1 unnamed protein product [Kuraishia capsulata CBS 1993]
MRLKSTLLLLFAAFVLPGYSFLLGIDFGYEFTKAALVAPGVNFEIVLTPDSKRKDVSGLAISPISGKKEALQRTYGSSALTTCTRSPASCMLHLKPLLGRSLADPAAKEYTETHPGVTLVESKNSRNTIAFQVAKDLTFPVEELLAMSIGEIRDRAEAHLKAAVSGGYSSVTDVAITVPSFFTQAQRAAIQDAVEIAGMNLVALVDDGTAVALNYASTRTFGEDKEYHLIYDMGAGSVKATLVSFRQNETDTTVEIEGVGYDANVGGHLLTNAVFELLKDHFLAANPKIRTQEFQANSRAMTRLWQSAEKAKFVLSANSETSVSLELLYDDKDFKAVITRDEFEEACESLMTRIVTPVIKATSETFNPVAANAEIQSVILAGGSTRVPFVQRHLAAFVGEDKISKNVNADEAAVLGATLRGVLLSKMYRSKPIHVIEHAVHDYRVQLDDSVVGVVLKKGDVPTETSVSLSPDSTAFSADIYEDGLLYVQYNAKVDLEASKLNSTTCPGGVGYNITFGFDRGLLSFERLNALCFNTSSEDVLKRVVISTKAKYASVRPMGLPSKQTSAARLKDLLRKDKSRQQRDEMINEYEAAVYDLRAYLDSDDVVEKGPPTMVDEASDAVREHVEWLDYESDGASLKDIKDRFDEIRVLKVKIETFVEMADLPLDKEEFGRLHQMGLDTIHELQELMLTMSEDASVLYDNYTQFGLNFDEESRKIKVKTKQISEAQIQEHFQQLSDNLEALAPLKEDDTAEAELAARSREELFVIREEVGKEVMELKAIVSTLKSVHEQRISALAERLTKHVRQQAKAAAKKARVAEKQNKADAEAEADASTATEPPVENTSSTEFEAEASPNHDEL